MLCLFVVVLQVQYNWESQPKNVLDIAGAGVQLSVLAASVCLHTDSWKDLPIHYWNPCYLAVDDPLQNKKEKIKWKQQGQKSTSSLFNVWYHD